MILPRSKLAVRCRQRCRHRREPGLTLLRAPAGVQAIALHRARLAQGRRLVGQRSLRHGADRRGRESPGRRGVQSPALWLATAAASLRANFERQAWREPRAAEPNLGRRGTGTFQQGDRRSPNRRSARCARSNHQDCVRGAGRRIALGLPAAPTRRSSPRVASAESCLPLQLTAKRGRSWRGRSSRPAAAQLPQALGLRAPRRASA